MESISRQVAQALRENLHEDFVESVKTGYYGDRFMTLLRELSDCLVGGNVLQLDAKDGSKVLMSKGGYWVDLDEVELTAEETEAIRELLRADKEGYWV